MCSIVLKLGRPIGDTVTRADTKQTHKMADINEDGLLLCNMGNSSDEAFATLFRKYYKDLVLFAGTILREQTVCEDIVQTIFLRLWDNRDRLRIETSLKSYLLSAVRNSCIEELRHRKIVSVHQQETLSGSALGDHDTARYILYSDLNDHLQEALGKLPPKLRECFEMNRFQNLKYREIAEQLNVSVRTVEVRIGDALNLLKNYLGEFYTAICIILLSDVW